MRDVAIVLPLYWKKSPPVGLEPNNVLSRISTHCDLGGAVRGALHVPATVPNLVGLYLALSPEERVEFLIEALGAGSDRAGRDSTT
jgi:hypothetical protein